MPLTDHAVSLEREASKAALERRVFEEFTRTARLDIDLATIESRKPPEPDIACATMGGEQLAFELAELCAPEIAENVAKLLRKGGGVSPVIPTADPTRAVILKKLGKRYASNTPVALLCWSGNRLVTPEDVVRLELAAALDEYGLGPFHSVWFLGELGAYQVR